MGVSEPRTWIGHARRSVIAPRLSPVLTAAIVQGYEEAKLTRKHALKMLRGSISDAELRPRDDSPFEVIDGDAGA